ncbi:MAG TPA: penicillin acylase family protein [Gemmataceae bacterium]|nr:penicillin acylase family protein [Gemmataceae bacterium]
MIREIKAPRSWLSTVCVLAVALALPLTARAGEDEENALARQTTIRRDHYGVPHILAATEAAAALGMGYAGAEDHAELLGRLFLQARGAEASVFGEKFAPGDFLVKRFHMYEGAVKGYQRLAPWVQRILDGYALGYNRYLRRHRAALPEWMKPIDGIDVLAHGRHVVLLEFSMNLEQLQRLGARALRLPTPEDSAFVRGSNMWAIGKGRSASGRGILLGNPHLTWAGSQIFYEAHITVPGKINISGCTLIGSPIITIGFNDHLGWSHTVNLHDSDDVYELTLDPRDPTRYVYDGAPVSMHKEEITVTIKTPAGLTARKQDAYWSHYGPIVKMADGKAYAFKSANMDEYRFVEEWNLMGKARNLDEFRKALDMQALPMFNICYADKEGNVFYLFNGRFPARPSGYNWEGVVPGDTSATEWNHILPVSRLPSLVNPPGSYVQNCNSAPWYTNLNALIDRRQYPDDLTPNFNSLRTQLSLEMLAGHDPMTLDKVKKCKFNTKMLLADRVKPDLLKIAHGQSADGIALDDAVAVLEAWDNTSARASKGSMLFALFWKRYGEEARRPYQAAWDEKQPVATPYGIGEPDTARKALAWAVKEMKEKYGALDVPWGELHRLRRGSVDVPIGGYLAEYRKGFRGARFGDFGSFRVIDYREEKDGKFVAIRGDSYVFAVEFTSPPTAYSISAYSQTDDPKSPHHTDQSILFANEEFKPAYFTEEDIARHLERSYHP